jgi:formiminoglutamase
MHQNPTAWSGRIDGNTLEHLRWHQIIKMAETSLQSQKPEPFFGIVGFTVDEGVQRNKGRIGAQKGPEKLRTFSSNFPVHTDFKIIDFGDMYCSDKNLENTQNELAKKISYIQSYGGKSIVLGGGHELMYGHYKGLRNAFPEKKIGIINFDAHFDNRTLDSNTGATSGTGFWQIAQEDHNYAYLAIGIQENSNTKALFNFAKNNKTKYILAGDFQRENSENIISQIQDFISNVDTVYLTICMDVFSAPFAPGVSAPAYNGVIPDVFFMQILKQILISDKLKAFDIAELNPDFDIDNSTARLGAGFIFEFVQNARF